MNVATLTKPIGYPVSIASVDEGWVRNALESRFPDIVLRKITRERVIGGTATKILFSLETESRDGVASLPDRICVKGLFDENIRAYFKSEAQGSDWDVATLFVMEVSFYRDMPDRLGIPLPECLLAIENGKDGVLILEDLSARDVVFCDARTPWSAGQAARMLRVFARMHAKTWGWKPGALPWIELGSRPARESLPALMSGDRFDELLARPQIRSFIPAGYGDRERLLRGLRNLWAQDDRSEWLALGHGDAHVGQTYIEPDGSCAMLDWQTAAIMPWSKDVAYFLGGALTVPDRREHERELLEYYLQQLTAEGGPVLDRAAAWDEYRAQMLQGVVWPFITEQLHLIEVISAMSERFLTAMGDLDPLAVIEARAER
ncbi:Ecdysteroid kinase [Sphingobium faniae]|nr:Ecdysteroid kinase [Sphingobium faniae]